MHGMCNGTINLGPSPFGLGEGPKGQTSFNFNYKVNSKDFKPNVVCLLTMKDIRVKHIRLDFHPVTWVMPQGWDLGCWGNMVIWHIKLKGMISRPGCTEKFYPRIKLVTLGRGRKVK